MSTVLSGTDSSQILTSLSQSAAGARFNLAFASLQNSYVERYNKEMELINRQAVDSYDTSLDRELAKLQEQLPKLQDYKDQVSNTINMMAERLDQIGDLAFDNASMQLRSAAGNSAAGNSAAVNTAAVNTVNATDFDKKWAQLGDTINNTSMQLQSATGNAVDTTDFDKKRAQLSDMLSRLPILDGSEFSYYGDEGVGDVRLNGLGIKEFSVDDEKTETGSTYELDAALSKANLLVTKLYNRLDMVAGDEDAITERIDQIKAKQKTATEEIKAKVQKIAEEKKSKIAAQLQALSNTFELSQQTTNKVLEAMNSDGGSTQSGTAVDILT